MQIVGEQIKLARLRRNLSVAQVAERATCSPLTVSRIEKGVPTVAIGIYLRVLYAVSRISCVTFAVVTTLLHVFHLVSYVKFLNVFVDAFIKHTHNFPMLPPNPAHTAVLLSEKKEMLDKEKMLSDSIRIN